MLIAKSTISKNEDGILAPGIIILIALFGLVGFAAALTAQNTYLLTNRASYRKIAQTASKSAIDWAKEQYDIDQNFNGTNPIDHDTYDGTDEIILHENSNYRVTFEVDVIETQYEFKRIEVTGRVYIPEISASTEFSKSIEAGIIRSEAGSGSPEDHGSGPIVWYDALDQESVQAASTTGPLVNGCAQTSQFLYERYDDSPSNSETDIATLTSNPIYPGSPSSSEIRTTEFRSDVNQATSFGARMSAQLCAPQDGDYKFWISGDDNVELYLSTDSNPANKQLIALHTDKSDVNEWDKYTSQASESYFGTITLEKDKQYYIEALMKEGAENDHVSVGWQLPDGTLDRPISAGNLSLPSEVTANTESISLYADYGGSEDDIAEERGSDAASNPGKLAMGGSDLEFSYNNANTGTQTVGIRYNGTGIPQGATITEAYIQFTTIKTPTPGLLSLNIYGHDHDDATGWVSNGDVTGATKTSNVVNWTPEDWNTIDDATLDQRTPDLTSVVQEIVNRPGFASDDLAFIFEHDSGSGVRQAYKGKETGDPSPQLYVEWESTSGGADTTAGDGDVVLQWNDQSGNNNHMTLQHGTGATKDNDGFIGTLPGAQPKPVVDFNSDDKSAYMAEITEDLAGSSITGTTFFVVLRFDSTATHDARVANFMDRDHREDYNTTQGAYLIQRNNNDNSIRTRHRQQCVLAEASVVDEYAIFTVWVEDGGQPSHIRINQGGQYDESNPNCPYNVQSADEIWMGGRRREEGTGSSARVDDPGNTTWFSDGVSWDEFLDGAIAEYIIYDYALEEDEVADIEYYLSRKWEIELAPEVST